MDSNKVFSEYVTSTAFNLSLSKNMVAFLALVACEDNPCDDEKKARLGRNEAARKQYASRAGRYDPIGAGRALLARGLIWSPYENWPGVYCLTDAGRLVVQLLVVAGMIEVANPESEAA